jgi:nucleotide-binding universal stress UspA family protein
MDQRPKNLGDRLLIALSDTPESLEMLRQVAKNLPNPANTFITLMHYLAPIYWEHGGVESPEDLEQIRHEEERIEEAEIEEEQETEHYFERARTILERAGVPSQQIDATVHYDENSAAEAVLTELKDGAYTGVIMGAEHHTKLLGLLGGPVTDVLRKHDPNVVVWVVEVE